MAAGQGYIEFATGDVLTAAAANGYLASQVVMVFASATARTSAIASPQEGMVSYLKDTNALQAYDGSTWVAVGGSSGSSFAGCRLWKNNTQALQDSTNTIITWDQESFDTDAFHDNSTNNSRITIPTGKAGKYLFTCILSLQSNTVGTRFIRLRKNGTNVANFGTRANNASGFPQNYVGIQSIETASVGDYFEIQAWQNSTEVQGLENGADQCLFSAAYLGA